MSHYTQAKLNEAIKMRNEAASEKDFRVAATRVSVISRKIDERVTCDKIDKLHVKVAELQEEIDEWKSASGLVDGAGDPGGVTPEDLQKSLVNYPMKKIAELQAQFGETVKHLANQIEWGEKNRSKIAELQAEIDRLNKRDGNATITLAYDDGMNPFAREDLQIADVSISENGYVVESETVKRLQAIVDKLPKYADTGEPIYPGRVIWVRGIEVYEIHKYLVNRISSDSIQVRLRRGDLYDIHGGYCYSTPEAAEAAK